MEDLINKQPELAYNDRGRIAWEGDALHKILGDEKPGQVHGMGLLPVPKQVYGRIPRRFKNMNISTEDTSSFDGVDDVREEMARLRERIENQAMVIEQLRNQQGSHENNETRVNHFFGRVHINILLKRVLLCRKITEKHLLIIRRHVLRILYERYLEIYD